MAIGRNTQSAIFRDGAIGRLPLVPTAWAELEGRAHQAMSRRAWAYVAGSAGNESTTAANRAALDRWRIVPRVLRDVEHRDLSVELFGHRYPSPILAAPVGVLGLVRPHGDLDIARAAAALGVPYILSTQASVPMERVVAAMGHAPHWYQLYWSSSDDLVESLVSRAEASGAQAIVVTLDTHLLGWRPRDLDLGYLPFAHGEGIAQYTSDPVFARLVDERMSAAPDSPRPRITPQTIRTLVDITRNHPGAFRSNLRSRRPRASVDTFLDVFSRSSLTWENLAFLRGRTSLPILLKGVQHPDDATRAVAEGVDGIIVSNHAGRQIDDALGSLDALPGIVERVDGAIPVLFDSGVRSGADVFVAMALGATAVCVGRAYTYGLAIAGQRGAAEVLRNLIAEFDITLGLSGNARADSIPRDAVARV
ncbi:alpha-hydroxy-acid oxidizing protein [Lacisediminihabitans changchengi]|uniref:Alpha-hydroxy-acid oxidizing protein n=1 Tax=Lacisediminihabitans changchengi TaxID=2787634 RepID=A0A934W2D1_9MICO|nr:alpha-hydroxy-acid oxidizing protein [Lacisediminihabitans changchengi]MBK4347084.1 alpha-hydroxy-acid oxidizing protein [Lacisediminihabitans changchengi]MBK4347793.1 alpha-hydroxy-acid oxidizing protein [Lacisediminihabitans changchengi]